MGSEYKEIEYEWGRNKIRAIDPKEILLSLHERRLRFIEASKENDFEKGIRNLLSELYPDRAHFIYELLQNAEDAKATEVIFQLTPAHLTLKHNGTRVFDEKDVEGITGIGTNIQKRDDVNAIGKFGVGFKAVFAYTETPRIYSRDFSFEIKDLFCPYPIEEIEICTSETQFVFPFNNPNKKPEDCFSEIAKGLNGLGDTTLLFLNNIETIIWDIEGQRKKQITRLVTNQSNIIEIQRQESDIQNPTIFSFWLRFQRKTELSDKLKIGVAFKLKALSDGKETDGNCGDLDTQMKIDDSIEGKLFIFFPAEKETTKLKFHINGPYASTIDRASIPHYQNENKLLLKETAILLAECLPAIRDAGYLTKDFLEVLPNDQDYLDDFYHPFISEVSSFMKVQPLVPTAGGKHVIAGDLLRGSVEIRRLISDDDLRFFTGKDGLYWAPGASRNSRLDRFLKMLEIQSWDEKEFVEALEAKFGTKRHIDHDKDDYFEKSQSYALWLSNKNDEWMQHLYAFLSNVKISQYPAVKMSQYQILRTEDGKHLQGNEGVFFPTEESTVDVGEVSFVKSAILSKGDKSLIEKVRYFLVEAGVKEIDEEQKIKHLLTVWYSSSSKHLKKKKHIAHMKRFVQWFRETDDVTIFQGYPIFMDAINGEFRKPFEYYIDKPFKDTGVAFVFKHDKCPLGKKYPISKVYLEINHFSDFALALGVCAGLTIEKTNVRDNPDWATLSAGNWTYITWTGIDEDYKILNLEKLCQMNDKNISNLIWRTFFNAKFEQLWAMFRPNQQYSTRKTPSQFVHVLRNLKWIPNKNGEFCKPAEMTKDQLLDGFIYTGKTDWLVALDFAKKVREAESISQEMQVHAEALGIKNIESIEMMKEIENDPDLFLEVQNVVKSRNIPETLPTGNLLDPERYIQKLREKAENSPKKEYVVKPVSQRVSIEKIDAKTWLKEEYTNEDGKIVCQICKKVMPFRTRNGEYYFEAVESFDNFESEIEEIHLALCPVCAAKYKEFVKPKGRNERNELERNEMQNFKSSIMESDSNTVSIELDKSETVYFTKKHITAIRTLLQE